MDNNCETYMDIEKSASYRYDDKLPAESTMLEKLLKVSEIQQLFESYYNLITIPVAIIDLNANVLLSSRWRRICTQFHRVHPTTCSRCIESDTKLATQLQEGKPYTIYTCKNGLTDCASPVIIAGKHIANVFIGQFLTKEPNEDWFRQQAGEFGFDVPDYLAALREVPVVDAEKIPVILDLLIRMTRVITNLSIDRKSAIESQARQSIILNAIPQSVFWKDRNGRYLGCNASFAKAIGLATPDDIVGKTDFDLPWPRQEAETYRADDLAVISANEPRLHIVEPLQQADGSRIVIDTSKIPLADAANNPYGVVGIYEDITERKQAEEALRKSELKYRELVENANSIILRWSPKEEITFLNEFGLKFFGYTEKEILGRHVIGTIVPEKESSGRDLLTLIDRISADPKSFEYNINENMCRNGKRVWISWTNKPVLDSEGHLLEILSIGSDITERKKAEDRIEKETSRTKLLLELYFLAPKMADKELYDYVLEKTVNLTDSAIGFFHQVADAGKDIILTTWNTEALKSCTAVYNNHYPLEQAGNWVDCVRYKKPIIYNDFPNSPNQKGLPKGHTPVKRFMSIPVIDHDVRLIFGVGNKKEDYNEHDVAQLQLVANELYKIIIARKAEEGLKESFNRLRLALSGTVQSLTYVVESRDPYTAGHQRRVCNLACAIASGMGLPNNQIEGIRMAALIHDLGKVAVPAEILSKPTKLKESEFAIIRDHPKAGYDILKDIDFPWPLARIVLEHHEKMDGTGYPNGLIGENILLESKILAVADVIEAMASHRPYRPALGIDTALMEIEKNKGTHYDGTVVDACLNLFREKGFSLEGVDFKW